MSNKEYLFFKIYMDEFKSYDIEGLDQPLIFEIISDVIPNSDTFILSYFTKFPERINSQVFGIIEDKELRSILHDIIVRHAIEIIKHQLSQCKF